MTTTETQTERQRRVTLPPKNEDTNKVNQSDKNDDPKRISQSEFFRRETTDRSDEPILSCNFEVFGIVQGRRVLSNVHLTKSPEAGS
ncbi:uncharacterized protein LOC108098492 isoform X2 [Drosophila ficusphila]|uniref:uncharacterized protein LOC108098492 isoform X2 n=1 Tax=Drosophila ficusphila TaxID=30025 RepID=UPI0007E89594|nr:uncharacterized protein LOC108098492 isoform X2 [Drosophila ficusphila]